jgi:hypothetical protein
MLCRLGRIDAPRSAEPQYQVGRFRVKIDLSNRGRFADFAFSMVSLVLIALGAPSSAVAQKPKPLDPTNLAKPPDSIQELITAGRVKFEAGQRSESAPSTGAPGITAETHYRIAYNYDSRSSWKLISRGRRVVVTVRYGHIQWQPTHTIWFRNQPASEDFWSNKLVLHELDHVRISSDPRLARRFNQLLKETSVLNRAVADGEVVNRQYVDSLVDQHVAKIFAEISDLIAIRYKELDRITNHGLHPVPSDSVLNQWLNQDRSDSE